METPRITPSPGYSLPHGEITYQVIGAFFEVYNTLRYGLLESAYASALEIEMIERGIPFEREVLLYAMYKGRRIAVYRADFVIAGRVIVELKATRTVCNADKRQLIHYMCLTGMRVGLLLHFGKEANYYRLVNSRG